MARFGKRLIPWRRRLGTDWMFYDIRYSRHGIAVGVRFSAQYKISKLALEDIEFCCAAQCPDVVISKFFPSH